MKKIIGLMLIIALLTPLMAMAAVPYATSQISITLLNQDPDPVEPGQVVDVRFRVENLGSKAINNFAMELILEYPLSLYSGKPQLNISSLDVYQTGDDAYVVKYTLKVDEKALEEDGAMKVKYTTDKGKTWTTVTDFSVNIDRSEALLSLESVENIPAEIAPGEPVTVRLKLKNLEGSLLKDIKSTLTLEDTTTATYDFAPVNSANQVVIDRLGTDEERIVEFNLLSTTTADIDVHKIPLTLSYYDNSDNLYTDSYIIGIKVYDTPSYVMSLEESTIYTTDQNGEVTFSIANTGTSNMDYLYVELEENEEMYSIIGSNKMYIGNLESDDFDTAEFSIHTKKSDQETIPMKLKLTYKDEYGKLFQSEESVNIPLYGSDDAVKYGLKTPETHGGQIFGALIGIFYMIFWAFMVINYLNNPIKPKAKKVLWGIMLLTIVGAVIYYLMARKRED